MSTTDSTKTCSKCRRVLPRSEFYERSDRPSGLTYSCIDCHKLLDKMRAKLPRALAVSKWHSMQQRIKRRSSYKDIKVRITRGEFLDWVIPLLESWNWSNGIPSVDRINSKGHYELGNMQIIPWSENSVKDSKNNRAPRGTRWCNKCGKYIAVSLFGPNKAQPSGLAIYCRIHTNQDKMKRRQSARAKQT